MFPYVNPLTLGLIGPASLCKWPPKVLRSGWSPSPQNFGAFTTNASINGLPYPAISCTISFIIKNRGFRIFCCPKINSEAVTWTYLDNVIRGCRTSLVISQKGFLHHGRGWQGSFLLHRFYRALKRWNACLAGGFKPSETYESQLGWLFPI